MTAAESNAPVGLREPASVGTQDLEYTDAASRELAVYVDQRQLAFSDALRTMDVVTAKYDPYHGSYAVMAQRSHNPDMDASASMTEYAERGVSIRELGYSSPSPFTAWTREEWNPKLRDKLGLREYYRMKRQDGVIRGSLRMLKTPIQAGRWFVEPGSESTSDVNVAKFVERNLFELLNVSWSRLLDDILLMCEYGHMVFEKVWAEPYGASDKVRDGKVRLQKLAPRHPLDVREWVYDTNGGPDGVVMEPTETSGFLEGGIFIPIDKLAIFALEAEAGDLRGISVLRSAYKHYFYKDTLYKIDAIQKERHGIGVPIIKLPPGFNKADKELAEEIGRNLRTNSRSHIVVPPGWEIIFAKLEGQPVDCLRSIDHHNKQIMVNILAPFLESPNVDIKSTDMFLKSTRYIALAVCDIINHHVIPQLVSMNFTLGKDRVLPMLRVRRVGEQEDLRTMSFTFRNFVGAGAIRPDDRLEAFLRRELDLPMADEETMRIIVGEIDDEEDDEGDANAPKDTGPSRSGPPRQKGTPPKGVGKSSQGRDRSGG